MARSARDGSDIRQRAFVFACRVVKAYLYLDKRGGAGRTLGRQLLKAGT